MEWFEAIHRTGKFPVRGVIHIGANDGAEYAMYAGNGVNRQIWIEPHPVPYERLLRNLPKNPDIRTFRVACGNFSGKAKMTLLYGNAEQSCSLLRPKLHLQYYPQFPVSGELEIDIVRLDELLTQNNVDISTYNLLVLDAQGYELECLKGAERTLLAMDYVLSEVNAEELYEGCALVGNLDLWLEGYGFRRVESDWRGPNGSFGDALYVVHRARRREVGGVS